MSQTEELQGGIFAKHQTRRYCFAAHTAFVGVNNISQNDKKKKSFLYCRSLQLEEMNENHHNMFISHSF